jgi:hypothetical protein
MPEREGAPTSKRPDTDGYPADTDGYPGSAERPEADGWWVGYGYSSFEEYLEELEENHRRVWGRPKRRRSELPSPTLGNPEVPRTGRVAGRKSRQLCLKLSEQHYAELASAADSYGVKPTTLARMLVRKGVNAIVEMDEARDSKGLSASGT